MKKSNLLILYCLLMISLFADPNFKYEYPKNPHEADSLMEIYYNELFQP